MNLHTSLLIILLLPASGSAGTGDLPDDTGDLPVKCGFPALAQSLTPSAGKLRSLLERPITQKNILSGGFRIHYDTVGIDAATLLTAGGVPIPGSANAFAESVATIMTRVVAREIDEYGYPTPPSDGTEGGGPEYDIYVQNLGNLYGETVPETALDARPDGNRYTTFLRVDNDFRFVTPDSNRGLPALRVTLAHEFHHAIQLGGYGYWTQDLFIYEITSVWMEDVVFTEVNDYYQYLRSSSGHFAHPDVPLTSHDFIMYSRGILCQYLEQRFGRDVIRRMWEHMREERAIVSLDDALQEQPFNAGFPQAFAEWTLWNYFTGRRAQPEIYYAEGSAYPEVFRTWVEFSGGSRTVDGTLKAAASRYYAVTTTADTFALVLANQNLSVAESGEQTLFPYTYRMSNGATDQSYHETIPGVFVKLDVADPVHWESYAVVRDSIPLRGTQSVVAEGEAFPNPFVPDNRSAVSIPLAGTLPVSGSLLILSSGNDRITSRDVVSVEDRGRQVIRWDGNDDSGAPAPTGIYLFVVSVNDRIIRGKIALVRRN